MTTQAQAATSTFPFFSILALIFITLKLLGEITWSWWWVLAPIWIPIALFVGVVLAIGIAVLTGFLISTIVTKIKRRRNTRPSKRPTISK